jgi:uncharacterized caspase-like protein
MAKNWAIVIGINGYIPTNFQLLRYAKRDAELVRDFFLSEAGFDEVCCFTDDSPALGLADDIKIPTYPSLGHLLSFLNSRFENPFLKPGDNCWFFFAGHGQRSGDRDYLMPIDSDPRMPNSGIAVNYVRERLLRSGADNVILLLDACRNDGRSGGLGIGEEPQQGVITISSCRPTQRSYEIEGLQQGAFTYALLEALRLPGERNCATVERLDQYLRSRVPQLCQEHDKLPVQNPSTAIDPTPKKHFILLPDFATVDDIATLKNEIFRAFVSGNLKFAEQLCVRAIAAARGRDLELLDLLFKIWQRGQTEKPISLNLSDVDSRSQPQAIEVSSQIDRASPESEKDIVLTPEDWENNDQGEKQTVLSNVNDTVYKSLIPNQPIVATMVEPLNSPILGEFIDVNDTAYKSLIPDQPVVATAGFLNPPIFGNFEDVSDTTCKSLIPDQSIVTTVAVSLNSQAMEDTETIRARTAPEIRRIGSAGHVASISGSSIVAMMLGFFGLVLSALVFSSLPTPPTIKTPKELTATSEAKASPSSAPSPPNSPSQIASESLRQALSPVDPQIRAQAEPMKIRDPKVVDRLALELKKQVSTGLNPKVGFTQELIYRINVAKDGKILDYQPNDAAAVDFLNETPLPNLRFNPSPGDKYLPEGIVSFRLILKTDGGVEVSPWSMEAPTIEGSSSLQDEVRSLPRKSQSHPGQ